MHTYELTRLVFNDGTSLEPKPLSVIVGLNNVGKSRALKDIAYKTTDNGPLPTVIIRDVSWAMPETLQALRDAYDVEPYLDDRGNWSFRTLDRLR